nr:hypothetical protein CFP56_22174 [Quercus suber]
MKRSSNLLETLLSSAGAVRFALDMKLCKTSINLLCKAYRAVKFLLFTGLPKEIRYVIPHFQVEVDFVILLAVIANPLS